MHFIKSIVTSVIVVAFIVPPTLTLAMHGAQRCEVSLDVDRDDPSGSETLSDVDRERVEEAAVLTLRNLQLPRNAAAADVHAWLKEISDKNQAGGKLSVMDYTTLLHIIKSDFISNLADPSLNAEAEEALVSAWFRWTGQTKSVENLLSTPLPSFVLKNASYREVQFHKAVFRAPIKSVARVDVEAPSRSRARLRTVLGGITLLAIGFAQGHAQSPGAQLLAGALTGYTVSSMAEWVTHNYYLHPNKATMKFLNRVGLGQAARFHSGNHHAIFRGDDSYSSAQNKEWKNAESINGQTILKNRDEMAIKHGDDPEDLHANGYGESMNREELLYSTVSTMSVAALICYVVGAGAEARDAALSIAPLTGLTTAYLHPYLHDPLIEAKAQANRLVRALMSTKFWGQLSQLHRVHHSLPKSANYSLFLPGPDFFFNTLRRPDLPMLVRMDELGLAY